MNNQQFCLAIGVPIVANAAMFVLVTTLLLVYMNSRFEAVNKRFGAVRDLSRTELRGVEEVLDAPKAH
jgi:predicted phosphoribosyltransferase